MDTSSLLLNLIANYCQLLPFLEDPISGSEHFLAFLEVLPSLSGTGECLSMVNLMVEVLAVIHKRRHVETQDIPTEQ